MNDPRWRLYRRKSYVEMRPYEPGEDLTGISVAAGDDPESDRGYIARDPNMRVDQWYVRRGHAEQTMELDE